MNAPLALFTFDAHVGGPLSPLEKGRASPRATYGSDRENSDWFRRDPDRGRRVDAARAAFGHRSFAGDLAWKGKHGTFYFPIATSVLLSLILTLVLNVWLGRQR